MTNRRFVRRAWKLGSIELGRTPLMCYGVPSRHYGVIFCLGKGTSEAEALAGIVSPNNFTGFPEI